MVVVVGDVVAGANARTGGPATIGTVILGAGGAVGGAAAGGASVVGGAVVGGVVVGGVVVVGASVVAGSARGGVTGRPFAERVTGGTDVVGAVVELVGVDGPVPTAVTSPTVSNTAAAPAHNHGGPGDERRIRIGRL